MARANDEMDLLGGDDEPAGAKADVDTEGAEPEAPATDQDEPMIQVRQSDLKTIQDALSNATALLTQYAPPEEEQPVDGGAEMEGPDEQGPGAESTARDKDQSTPAPTLFGGRSRSLRGL